MDADAWCEAFLREMGQHPRLRREFAHYQSNVKPGELRKAIPKFYRQLVESGLWTEDDFRNGVIGVVCQRRRFRVKMLEWGRDRPEEREPNPAFAKRKQRSASSRRWAAEHLGPLSREERRAFIMEQRRRNAEARETSRTEA